MKIAISSMEKTIDGNVSDIFGRCPYFIIVEVENNKIIKTEVLENKSINQMGGAGISSAQLIAEKGVNAVITGNVGPRALDVLNQFKIDIYSGEGTIKDVVNQLIEGKIEKIN